MLCCQRLSKEYLAQLTTVELVMLAVIEKIDLKQKDS